MVGRTSELASVVGVLDGSGHGLVVAGEAGVGKTRLVTEATEVARTRGVVVVTGRCLPLSAGLPLLPVVDSVRSLSEAGDGDLWTAVLDGVPPQVRHELSRVVPDVVTAVPGVESAPGSAPWQQARLFDAVRQLLQSAGRRRVALLVEDVHWADPATSDLLEYVLASGPATPLPIVLTYRTREVVSPEVGDWLGRLLRVPGSSSLSLRPFQRADAVAHVRALAGDRVDQVDIAGVVRRSEGNPFYLEQLVRSRLQDDDLEAQPGMPARLSSFLVGRTRAIEGLPRDVLLALAVAASPVDERFLAEACAASVGDVRVALHELRRRYLVRAAEDSDDILLAHALLGEAIVSEMLPGEQRDWHLRVASALEADPDPALAGATADHYRRAGRVLDELRWRIRAGQHADALFAPELASAQWERALALADEVRGADAGLPLSRPRLHLAAARALYLSGQGDSAVRVIQSALDRFGDETDEHTHAALLAGLGAYVARRDPDAARRSLREAVTAYDRLTPDLAYLAAAFDYVDCLLLLPRLAGVARAVNERALAAAATLDVPDKYVQLLLQQAWLDLAGGNEVQCLAKVARARGMLATNPSPYATLQFAAWYSDILLKLGRPGDVPGIAELTGMGDGNRLVSRESELTSVLRANLCQARLQLGETTAAAQLIDPLTESPPVRDMWLTHAYRATLDMLRGRSPDSEERWGQLPRTGEGQDDYEVEPARVELLLWLHRPVDALEHGLEVLRARAGGEPRLLGPLLVATARAHSDATALTSGADPRLDRLSALGQELSELHAALPVSPFVPGALRPTAEGDSRTWAAEWGRAEGVSDPGLWESAANAYAGYPRPHLAAYARWRQAQALLSSGGRSSDVALALRRAAGEAVGHEPLTIEIRRLAERARVPLDRPVVAVALAPNAFGLTDRELTVLRLVARGDTNGQIGRQLFISEKTASVHVSNILRKLGVGNRLQAAAVAEHAGLLAGEGAETG